MFRQGFTCPALLKDLCSTSAYGAITRSGRPFQTVLLTTEKTTGLLRVSLATTRGISVDVCSSRY